MLKTLDTFPVRSRKIFEYLDGSFDKRQKTKGFENETAANIRVRSLDPNEKFTLHAYPDVLDGGDKYKEIQYRYIGESVRFEKKDHGILPYNRFVRLFCDLKSVFAGLVVLEQADIVHMNISADTILHSETNSQTYLINFGNMLNPTEINIYSIKSWPLMISPPEVDAMKDSLEFHTYKSFVAHYCLKKTHKLPDPLIGPYKELTLERTNDPQLLVMIKNKALNHVHKVNVYMLGLAILQMFVERLDFEYDDTGDLIFYKNVFDLIASMTQFDPGQRLDPTLSCAIHAKIVDNLFERLQNRQAKFLAQGSFGCVFVPHIPCSTDEDPHVKKIFKVFTDRQDFVTEYKTGVLINKIDPTSSFTVKMFSHCLVKIHDNGDQFKLCHSLQTNTFYEQILFQHGGITLKQVETKDIDYKEIFSHMGSAMKGLVTLNANRIVHMDIKPENMVYGLHNSALSRTKKCVRLIDFGLAVQEDMVYNNFLNFTNYWWSPPEFKAISLFMNGSLFTCEEELPFYSLMEFQKATAKLESLPIDLHQDYKEMCYRKNIYQTDADFILEVQSDLDAFANRNVHKVDVYMLGLTMLHIFLDQNIDSHHSIHEHKHRTLYVRIFSLITGMTQFDPNHRYSAQTALAEYEKIFPNDNGT